ncbi:WD40 repeat-like protein [Rhizodiscina lignyota]|uniref:WD40 repeat-like protein n=1 Tax=Rhizodiscina lignyota TaxID=1504668 RepID=A0A9P4IHC0_9PEZI|nr:WD40 repeat-like protein [Rhizodiscina lignyota]
MSTVVGAQTQIQDEITQVEEALSEMHDTPVSAPTGLSNPGHLNYTSQGQESREEIELRSSLVSDLFSANPSHSSVNMGSWYEGTLNAFQFEEPSVTVNPVFRILTQSNEASRAVDPHLGSQPGATDSSPTYRDLLEESRLQNYEVDVCKFIDNWTFVTKLRLASQRMFTEVPGSDVLTSSRPSHVRAEEVNEDTYDMQGIDWTRIGTSGMQARKARDCYCEAVSGDCFTELERKSFSSEGIENCDSLFRFRRMNTKHRAWIQHFQLRNLMAVTSHNDIFYAARSKVHCTDAVGGVNATVMDLSGPASSLSGESSFRITTLAAASNLVVSGSYTGEYAMASLDSMSSSPPTIGLITPDHEGIICHVDLFARRGIGQPTSAAFSSNDQHVRVLDCATNTFVSSFKYPYSVNCSVADPHAQMRLVVGDSNTALLTNADDGQVLTEIAHHTGNIFAASWCGDGVHVATGAEDGRVLVYDMRKWSAPVADIACVKACPRSLRFSSRGPSMLLVAEAEDAVEVVEAGGGMFQKRQVVEFFGSVGGAEWRPDGKGFWVANGDAKFGGLMQFDMMGARLAPSAQSKLYF